MNEPTLTELREMASRLRPQVRPCSAFGGRSQKTGKLVGSRHRWSGDGWGKGSCDYCGRTLNEVLQENRNGE